MQKTQQHHEGTVGCMKNGAGVLFDFVNWQESWFSPF